MSAAHAGASAVSAAGTTAADAGRYCMGDYSGGPIEPRNARTLAEAVSEAKESAMDAAKNEASAYDSTALQDWVVYSVDGISGERTSEDSGMVQADPEPPACADGRRKHEWRNPDPQWSGYGNAQGGGVTVVRECPHCGIVRTVMTRQSDNFANVYDSVSYRRDGE